MLRARALLLALVAGLGSGACSSGTSRSVWPDQTGGATTVGGSATAAAGMLAATAGAATGGAGNAVAAAGAPASPVECQPVGEMAIGVAWSAINSQPAAFYATPAARALAENILYYQNDDHGWPKNVDMTTRTTAKAKSTIDNRGTTTEIEYLARVFGATGCASYQKGAVDGLQGLFSAQYDNGGWPQYLTTSSGYQRHITFNDDAMVHVLTLLRAVGRGAAPYGFVDDAVKASAAAALDQGIDCLLACQIHLDGEQRGWCAQHDEVTLKPAQARTYELPSISGSEGAGIARFLMTVDPPTPEIRAAVEGAIAWFEAVKLTGIRVDTVTDASQSSGEDRVVVEDPNAPPLWARFYELGTNRPLFSSRCEVAECEADPFFMRRYSLAEIENERRVGYAWYGNWPAAALSEYAAWKKKYP